MTDTQVYFFKLGADENVFSYNEILEAKHEIDEKLIEKGFEWFDTCNLYASYKATGNFEAFKNIVQTVARLHNIPVLQLNRCKHSPMLMFY